MTAAEHPLVLIHHLEAFVEDPNLSKLIHSLHLRRFGSGVYSLTTRGTFLDKFSDAVLRSNTNVSDSDSNDENDDFCSFWVRIVAQGSVYLLSEQLCRIKRLSESGSKQLLCDIG